MFVFVKLRSSLEKVRSIEVSYRIIVFCEMFNEFLYRHWQVQGIIANFVHMREIQLLE